MGTTFFAVKTVFEHKRCHLAVIVKSPLQQVQHPCWCYFGKWNPAITFDGSQFFPLLITVVNFLEILQALINQLPRCPNLLHSCMPLLNCYFLLRKTKVELNQHKTSQKASRQYFEFSPLLSSQGFAITFSQFFCFSLIGLEPQRLITIYFAGIIAGHILSCCTPFNGYFFPSYVSHTQYLRRQY